MHQLLGGRELLSNEQKGSWFQRVREHMHLISFKIADYWGRSPHPDYGGGSNPCPLPLPAPINVNEYSLKIIFILFKNNET